MINNEALINLISYIPIPDPNFSAQRYKMWFEQLGLGTIKIDNFAETAIKQAIRGTVCNFNYWETESGITWPNLDADDWFAYIRHEKDLNTLNLPKLRVRLLNAAEAFINDTKDLKAVYDQNWWQALTHVYGGDPLRKRETLLWIILHDLDFRDIPCPNKGCIDYNIILLLRYYGIVTGYEGNMFDLYTETRLRFECLTAVERMLIARPDLNISSLDAWLWYAGKNIRHTVPRDQWDPYFPYRRGCFFF